MTVIPVPPEATPWVLYDFPFEFVGISLNESEVPPSWCQNFRSE